MAPPFALSSSASSASSATLSSEHSRVSPCLRVVSGRSADALPCFLLASQMSHSN